MISYRDYYAACRAAYGARPGAADVYRLGVHSQAPASRSAEALFELDEAYTTAVRQLADAVDARVQARHGIHFERDPDVRELAVKLDAFWDLDCLETIADCLIPQAEDGILGSYGLVNQVNLMRSLPGATALASSWLWHYDNKPDEAFKILIYLTDVDAFSGAFEYLRDRAGSVVKIPSSRRSPREAGSPRWPQSRVPAEVIEHYRALGYESCRVTGACGTLIAFDNNCIHRAIVPMQRHRDVVILNVRPCHQRVQPYISKRHTGSWSFNAKQWIPEQLDVETIQ